MERVLKTSRVAAYVCYGVAALLVVAGLGWAYLSNAFLAFSSPGLSLEPMTRAVATVVSVGPPEAINTEEIEQARSEAEREGIPLDEAVLPEPSMGSCTVTFTFAVDGESRTAVERAPRAQEWCTKNPGDVIDVAYPVGRPEKVTDDYDHQYYSSERAVRQGLVGTLAVAGLVLLGGVVSHLRARRRDAAPVV